MRVPEVAGCAANLPPDLPPRMKGYPDLIVFEGSQPPGFQSLDQCVYVGPVVLRRPWRFLWVFGLRRALPAGAGWIPAIQAAWTEADQALRADVLNFWFLGRVFDRVRA